MAYGSCNYQKTPKLLVFVLEYPWDYLTTLWLIQLMAIVAVRLRNPRAADTTGLGINFEALEVIWWPLWKDPKVIKAKLRWNKENWAWISTHDIQQEKQGLLVSTVYV